MKMTILSFVLLGAPAIWFLALLLCMVLGVLYLLCVLMGKLFPDDTAEALNEMQESIQYNLIYY